MSKARKSVNIAMKEIFWWAPKLDSLYPFNLHWIMTCMTHSIYQVVGPQLKIIWLVRDVRGTYYFPYVVNDARKISYGVTILYLISLVRMGIIIHGFKCRLIQSMEV